MKRISFLLFLAASVLLFDCGGGGGSSPQGRSSNKLFLAMKATTPTFTATVSVSGAPKMKSSLASAPTFSDQAMNLAFQLLRDYSYPADEGVVDMTNIYKVLYEAGGYLDDAKSICSPLSSAVTDSLISSYAFSDFLGHTYDCGGNMPESGGYGSSVAYREAGLDKYMLATYKWAPDDTQQITIGAIQTRFNDTTKDVELTFAQTVNYPAGSDMGGVSGSGFATRTYIKGNSDTHAFELKLAMSNQWGSPMSIVGKGISQGAGNYFLMRDSANYYCLPAGATETDLRSITPTDYTAATGGACTAYVADVDTLYLTKYVGGQIPNYLDLVSFNSGTAGTPVNYLLFP
jgi:hypothetical protein